MDPRPAITTYGALNASAPAELGLFSFLVGKWRGLGDAIGADGSPAHFEMSWIGRYVMDGMAIADEFHGSMPDGSPYLGISLRHFDRAQGSWIVEYLNVTGSFLRRQVNPRSGSVRRDGDTVVVISEDGATQIRERYRLIDNDHFMYSTEVSPDAGRTWDPPAFELSLTRAD